MNIAPLLLPLLVLQPSAEEAAPVPPPGEAAPAEPALETAPPPAAEPGSDEEKPVEKPKRRPKKKPPAISTDTPATPEAPKTRTAAAARDLPPDPERVAASRIAIRFFEALIAERTDDIASLCRATFNFEGKTTANAQEMRARWEDIFAQHEGARYTLYGVELLSASEAVAKYGKPPKRLTVPAAAFVAVGNLSGRPTVVLIAKGATGWQAVGMHD